MYFKRIIDNELDFRLKSKGAVLIEGPKWCGKTTTAEQKAKSILYVDKPDLINQNIILSQVDPLQLLEGDKPRLIDEWQIIPKIWNTIRFDVDHSDNFGKYILTGSTTPLSLNTELHSGTGRFSFIKMSTMSLYESLNSSGEVSLNDLFNNPSKIKGSSKTTLNDLAYLTCRGGWPKAIGLDEYDVSLQQAKDYYDGLLYADIDRVDGVKKDKEKVKKFFKSYARNQGTQVSLETLAKDTFNGDYKIADSETIANYIKCLNDSFVIDEVDAWNPNLRSKTAIRTSKTRYFVDPSIATSALNIGPKDLINDLKTFGFIFESLCIRDLKVYANSLKGKVYHYRDKNDLECDAVIHLENGKYGLIEIKLGGDNLIEDGVETLKKLKEKIDTTKMEEPSFLMVLIGVGPYAYKRDDGVFIVPITCLKN